MAPAVLAGSTGENGLKTWGMDPSGLPSITSVALEEPDDDDGVDDQGFDELHAPSPSAVTTHAEAASGPLVSLIAPQLYVGKLPAVGVSIASW